MVLFFCNVTKIEYDNFALILGFVGIIATFIVVGNYAQVMTIKSEFEEKINNINKANELQSEKIKNESNILFEKSNKQNETLRQYMEGSIYNLQANNHYNNGLFTKAYLSYTESAIMYNEAQRNGNLKSVLNMIIKVLNLLYI